MDTKTKPIILETESPSEDYSSDGLSGRPVPPPDGGAGAWKFLVGAFVVEAVLWGAFNLEPNGHVMLHMILIHGGEQASRYRMAFSRTTTPYIPTSSTIATSPLSERLRPASTTWEVPWRRRSWLDIRNGSGTWPLRAGSAASWRWWPLPSPLQSLDSSPHRASSTASPFSS